MDLSLSIQIQTVSVIQTLNDFLISTVTDNQDRFIFIY